jgi:hypothetical protein
MSAAMPREGNDKYTTALILAGIALVFFIGVIVRHWLW